MMKSHFLPVCQHANFNPISQLLTLNVLIVNKRRHDYNYKSNVWPFPVSAHDHWSEDSEGKEPHLPPGHEAPGRPLHLQRGQRVRQTGNSQGTVRISRKSWRRNYILHRKNMSLKKYFSTIDQKLCIIHCLVLYHNSIVIICDICTYRLDG